MSGRECSACEAVAGAYKCLVVGARSMTAAVGLTVATQPEKKKKEGRQEKKNELSALRRPARRYVAAGRREASAPARQQEHRPAGRKARRHPCGRRAPTTNWRGGGGWGGNERGREPLPARPSTSWPPHHRRGSRDADGGREPPLHAGRSSNPSAKRAVEGVAAAGRRHWPALGPTTLDSSLTAWRSAANHSHEPASLPVPESGLKTRKR